MKRILIVCALLALGSSGLAFAGAPGATASSTKPASSRATGPKAGIAKSGARLDEVHIKGEIPEPQVLFVVGRERRRFLDFQHRRYLDGRGNATAADPGWVRVVDSGRPAAD